MHPKLFFFFIILTMLVFACRQDQPAAGDAATRQAGLSGSDSTLLKSAATAYMYGLPLVLMDITRRQSTAKKEGNGLYAPLNQFYHNAFFPDASFKEVVRPNNDTYYSIAWLDLEQEPVVLSVPNTGGRYYMMPMLDAYSNVFASPGTRTTGNKAGTFLISGPQWTGAIPDGMQQIKSPTNMVWIIGRTQVNSKEDGAKVVAPLQKQYTLTPLSARGKARTADPAPTDSAVPAGDPNTIVRNMPINEYFNYVNQLMARNPPPEADQEALRQFAALGVGPGKTFDVSAYSDGLKKAMTALPGQVLSGLEKANTSAAELINGWNPGPKVIGTYGTDYLSRAAVAFFGLGANLREDAIYPNCFYDQEGKELTGSKRYTLRFEKGQTPPANAFWSITLYDADGYFIDNPINRYAVGDRSNLKTNADGSVEIYIQHDNPGKDKESNWLPAPTGPFNLLMRVYWPKPGMLDRTWTPPAVVAVK
ncbi:MAG: DUF1254 domain-containing protein [Saprospiraceae bacterium]|nr:DUF1254 domain-containing protein [Saprospiraceae bacterium]